MNAFTTRFNVPRASWDMVNVYFNWNLTEDLHTRIYHILNEFSENEQLAELLEAEGFKRDDASGLAVNISFSRTAKMTELIFKMRHLALLYEVIDFIIGHADHLKIEQPEKIKPFEEFRQSFFKLISLGVPMPSALDTISNMVEMLVRRTPKGAKTLDARFKKQTDDLQRHPKLTDGGLKKPVSVLLFELRNSEAKHLGSTQVIFRWFVPAAAHLFLMHFIGRNKAHLYKVLNNPDTIAAFEEILQKLEDGQHFDNYRTALFVTSYRAAIALTEICYVISDMKLDSTGREFIGKILAELPNKLPVV